MHMIVAIGAPVEIAVKITEQYPDRHLQISGNAWLVATQASTKEVSSRLSASMANDELLSAVIVQVRDYYGYASNNIWEWVAEHAYD